MLYPIQIYIYFLTNQENLESISRESISREASTKFKINRYSVTKLCPTLCHPMDCSMSLTFTISQNLLKLISIESVILYNHLILCHPFSFCLHSFPALGSFPMSGLFISGSQSIGASASVLPMNIRVDFL